MFHVVIPARFGSTRLPGKALVDIHGHPMLYWVWQRALLCGADSVIVATDDQRIASVMRGYGADVAMTQSDHLSGTDRLAEVSAQRDWSDDTIVVNLQGDEPLMPPENLVQVAEALKRAPHAAIATLCEPINDWHTFASLNVVKVVRNADDCATYFSRSMIPRPRGVIPEQGNIDEAFALEGIARHVGLYAYRAGFLRRFITWPPAPSELIESLEQLRALYYGEQIKVVYAQQPVPAGVDTEEDLSHVRRLMAS